MKILDLFEGLIKIPTYTEEKINRLITVIVLLALKKKSSPKYPEINKILKKEIKLNNINGKLPDDKVLAYFIKWDGLSPKYPDTDLAERDGVKGIYLAFSMEHKGNSLGSWNNKNSSMVLFPRVLPGWDQFPNCDADNIKWFIETLQDTAKHELMHAVQYRSLATKDPKQTEKLPNYHEYGNDYHNSQIEFDPTIASCAGDFVKTWRLFKNTGVSGKKLNLKELFKTFVCVLPERKFTLYTNNDFFKALKKTNPTKWHLAIKKFTIEVNRLLAENKESLSETKIQKVNIMNNDIKVYIGLSKFDLFSLLQRFDLRGVKLEKEFIFWNAYQANHDDVADEFKKIYGKNCFSFYLTTKPNQNNLAGTSAGFKKSDKLYWWSNNFKKAENDSQFQKYITSTESLSESILLEDRIEFLTNKYNLETPVFEKLKLADPTKNKIYLQWLIELYIKKNLKLEDLYKATEYLTIYTKKKQMINISKRNINQIKSLPELFSIIEPIMDKKSENELDKEQREKIAKEIKTVYSGPEGKILVPLTKEASCFLGRGTQWCTAANKNNLFKKYNKKGPLYVIICNNGKKYQLHFSTVQLMDETDREISFLIFENNYPWVFDNISFSEEEKLSAVRENGYAIRYIENPSEELQLAAVKENGNAIQYINNPSEKVRNLAKQKGWKE